MVARAACFFSLVALTTTPAAAFDPLPVEYFARLPAIGGPSEWTGVALSPDGAHFAAIIAMKGQPVLASVPTDGSKDVKLVGYGDYQPLEFEWANDTHLLVHFAFATKRQGVATSETRLGVFDIETGKLANLVGYEDAHELDAPTHVSQIQDSVVSRLPVDGNEVLVELDREEPGSDSVYSFTLDGGSTGHRYLKYRQGIVGWFADAKGIVRLGVGYQSNQDERLLHDVRLIFRTSGDEDFTTLTRFDPRDLEGAAFAVEGFTPDPKVILIRDLNEQGRMAIYRFDTATSKVVDTVFSDPKYDAGGVSFVPGTDRLLGVSYVAEEPHTVYFDEGEKADEATVTRLHPGLRARIISRDASGAKGVVKVGSASSPPAYYYFDISKNIYSPLGSAYPELAGRTLSETRPVSYAARDGLQIDGFLTVPKGAPPGALPLIVFPHGGPASRDYMRYDYWVQYFASRGWAVLQPNFRGSDGYGRAFEKAGEHQWGRAMQDDISDGVAWAVAEHVADPARICIVGASYGGYAALQGATSTPGLYKCAVSLNGVADLQAMVSDARFYTSYLLIKDYLSQEDPSAVSPVNHAEAVAAPVLVAYGTKDRVVDNDQSRSMVAALRRAGKEVVEVKLDDGDHYLTLERNRLAFFQAMDKFLVGNLGLGAVPDPAVIAGQGQ
ncbi:MAG: prolyl oligopeptidase family serine peptidase [Alphaproteobacteria bacterium]|nr:prolyl oligopeptidase family serine peptidase [Alphaproteobacteria bacterium]